MRYLLLLDLEGENVVYSALIYISVDFCLELNGDCLTYFSGNGTQVI